MKTIRQLSEELKISKEAIYKKLKYQLKEPLANHVEKIDGVTHIDAEGERLIIQSLRTERQEALEGVLEHEGYDYTMNKLTPVRELINTLTEQIKTKDEQIKIQSEHIGLLIHNLGGRQLLLQAERLRLLPGIKNDIEHKAPARKKPLWKRIFKL